MQWFVIPFLRYLLLPLLKWTTQRRGDSAWSGWGLVTQVLARITGQVYGLLFPRDSAPLDGIMKITDMADDLIGATGEWKVDSDSSATKIITHCPLAEQLTSTPEFCTKLGLIMGQEAYKAYAPNFQVDYKIPTTLSQGHIACQYIIQMTTER